MTKTALAYEPSKLAYPHAHSGSKPKPDDEQPQPQPQAGPDRPKSTLPKYELDPPQAPRQPPSTRTTDRPLREYLTRRQAADFIRDELGRPMSFSTASKLAALREFATPALWWGRRPLYARDDLRAWAESRSRPTKQRIERAAVPENTASTPLPTPRT
jgi:hypothetical protein